MFFLGLVFFLVFVFLGPRVVAIFLGGGGGEFSVMVCLQGEVFELHTYMCAWVIAV